MSERVIVYGGRDYTDRENVRRNLAARLTGWDLRHDEIVVVDGACPDGGADQLAHEEATALGFATERHPAAWLWHDLAGVTPVRCHHAWRGPSARCPAAGPRRNQEMVDRGAWFAIEFPGGRGTADMRRRLEAAGIPIVEAEELT